MSFILSRAQSPKLQGWFFTCLIWHPCWSFLQPQYSLWPPSHQVHDFFFFMLYSFLHKRSGSSVQKIRTNESNNVKYFKMNMSEPVSQSVHIPSYAWFIIYLFIYYVPCHLLHTASDSYIVCVCVCVSGWCALLRHLHSAVSQAVLLHGLQQVVQRNQTSQS